MSICTIFLANAFGVHMGLGEQLGLMAIMLLTSKGAATVSGGTYVVFASTVAATGYLPLEGVAILFGVYRFMSIATAFCNTFGNVVATIVVSKLTMEMDVPKVRRALADPARFLAEMERQEAKVTASPAESATDGDTGIPAMSTAGNHGSPSLSTASTK
jgi:aerobic C4-dicarboxylate transport protein